jgi:hypothetical protein
MNGYNILIPETLYQKAQRLAERTAQSVDDLIRERLAGALEQYLLDLPADELAELRALTYLSDDTLWTIAREQMQTGKQERLSSLMDRNSRGVIVPREHDELEALVESGQRLMLRKAEAMRLLMERGYTISLDRLKSVDE